jgi:hypothetical protein
MLVGGIDRPSNNGETMAQWLERRRRELQALEAPKPPTIDAIALQPEPPSEEQPPSEEPGPPLFWPKPPQR